MISRWQWLLVLFARKLWLRVSLLGLAGVATAVAGIVLAPLVCSPETSPGLGFESGYFQALGWRHGYGTERQVDRGDHRGTSRS